MNRINRTLSVSVAIGTFAMALISRPAPAANVSSRPIKFGTALPTSCWPGDVFFNVLAPAGANLFACVATNTWALQALTNIAGDVSGAPASTTVTQIQGKPVATTAPQSGQVLAWNSSAARWEPQSPGGGSQTLAGDVTGALSSNTVTQIQGKPVSTTTPQASQVLTWNSSASRWEPQAPAALPLAGDLAGTSSAATVTQIQGRAVASTAPQSSQVLTWNSSASRWEPQAASGGSITLAGDVTGAPGSNTVTQIQGRAVASTAPASGQVMLWNGSTNRWEPQEIAAIAMGGDISGISLFATVTQIQGRPVASTAPQASQVLTWNSTASRWEPQTPGAGSITLSGDVTGDPGSNTVTQIQGRPVASATPSTGQALIWNGTAGRWEPQTITSGGGGASMAAQLGDLQVTKTGPSTLAVGANCSNSTPCNVQFGGVSYSITAATTVSLTSGTGDALVYFASSGALRVGHTMNLTCSGTCQAVSDLSAFPSDAIPLYSWHATNGVWDDTGSDQRAVLSSKNVFPGAGLVSTEASGHTTLAVDSTIVGMRTAVPASSTSTCLAGSWAADTSYYYVCVFQNTWRRAALNSW